MSGRSRLRHITLAALLSAALHAEAGPSELWTDAVTQLSAVPHQQQIQAVTDWVHLRLRFADDPQDLWESPFEALARGEGDCEDFAFAKYALLRQLGWKAPQVRLAHGYTTATGRRQAHMVVLVETADTQNPLVLDNLGDFPVPLSVRSDLTLTFSFSEATIWEGASHTVHSPASKLSRWTTLVNRMRAEGSLPAR